MVNIDSPSIFALLSMFVEFLVVPVNGGLLDNGVQGEPEVECARHALRVRLLTARPFEGRLFVDGESGHVPCHRRFSGDVRERVHASGYTGDSPLDPVVFEVAFEDCNMRRQRTLNPRGVEYSFTLIVFVTKSDRAYRIRCFYTEAVKAIDTEIHVSQLTTRLVEREFVLPSCRYHLKRGVEGPLVRFANVGDRVTHVWQCDPDAEFIYGMLIHSCYVDDGNGNKVQLVDDRGCGIDRDLLPGIRYNEHLLSAFVDTWVFKYADRIQLYFTCTVQLCFRGDGGCEGITPPSCGVEDVVADTPSLHHLAELGGHPPIDFPSHHPVSPDDLINLVDHHHHSEKPFFGPIDSVLPRHSRPFAPLRPPYKDSPLEWDNQTETSNTSNLVEDVGNRASIIVPLDKGNNRLKRSPMEMDLSMDVFVLPLDAIANSNASTLSPIENSRESVFPTDFCLSGEGVALLLASLFILFVVACTVTALVVGNHHSTKPRPPLYSQ